jgi:putative Holliday junction resolvase
MTGRILAVDPGRRRWGFAVSDPARVIAARFWTENLSPASAGARIAAIAAENDAVAVVIGVAVRADRSEGNLAHIARTVGASLRRSRFPVLFHDESLTTRLAEAALAETSAGRRKRRRRVRAPVPSALRRRVDGLSAAVLLQYYLKQTGQERGQFR